MKSKIVALTLAGVLSLGIVGCGQQQQQQAEPVKTEEKVQQVESTIKWTDAANAEEAAKGAGFEKFGVPGDITLNGTKFENPKFAYTQGVAQATYESGAMTLVVRKASGTHTAPLSDRDTTTFASKWTNSIEGLDVTLCGATQGNATVMTWTDGTADFGVTYQGTGGEEISLNADQSAAVVKAIKEANAATAAAQTQQTNTQQQSNTTNNQNATSNQGSSSTQSNGDVVATIDGFEVKYTKDQCMQIAAEYAGAGGQAKGEAQNLNAEGPITGGGTVYYKVTFNLGDVAYEVQVDAVGGKVISGTQVFNGQQELLDEQGNPIEGTAQAV